MDVIDFKKRKEAKEKEKEQKQRNKAIKRILKAAEKLDW